jgi:hypothetical protein
MKMPITKEEFGIPLEDWSIEELRNKIIDLGGTIGRMHAELVITRNCIDEQRLYITGLEERIDEFEKANLERAGIGKEKDTLCQQH